MHRLSDALVQVPTSQCRFVRESECLEQPRRRLVAIHDPGLQPRQAEVSDRPVNHVLYRQSAMTVPPVSWMPDTDADLSSPVTPVDGVDRTLPYQFSVRRSQHEVVFGPWLRGPRWRRSCGGVQLGCEGASTAARTGQVPASPRMPRRLARRVRRQGRGPLPPHQTQQSRIKVTVYQHDSQMLLIDM